MKTALKNLVTMGIILSILAGVLSVLPTSVFASETNDAVSESLTAKTITVDLNQDTDYSYSNMSYLSDALKQADDNTLLTVKIKTTGTYYVGSNGSAIKLKSNTILDLNGSTLIRSGSMYNFIQNADINNETKYGKGYEMTRNITIKNGTLDGSGGSSDEVNLVNLGHASNITIENVNLKNCRGGHLIEMAGCKDSLISNCTFTDYTGSTSGSDNEAIQLDICNNSVAGSWNGVYYSDSTVCKNITVDSCTFNDYPAGVGNHHTIAGLHNSEIKITNNKFQNTKDTSQIAIWCYGFDDSTVSGNIISGNYSSGVKVSGGSVNVKDNTISNVSYKGIEITKSNSYTLNKKNVITEEYAQNCTVEGNNINVKGSNIAVSVFSSSGVNNFSDNTISASGESAVVISGKGTKINDITNNTIKSSYDYGILIASESTVSNINSNTISGKSDAIRVSSNASVTNIGFNKSITAVNGSGICVTGSGANSIIGNVIKNCGEDGILVKSSGVVSKIQANAISGCNNYGIEVNNSSITVAVGQNSITGNKIGTTKIKAKVTTPGELTNLPAPVIKSVSSVDGGVKITWDAILGASKYRVFYKNANGKWERLGDTTSSSYTHTAVTSGTSYTYAVRCITSNGKSYASSYDKTGKTVVYIATPKVTKIENATTGVSLKWDSVKGAYSYRVFRKNGSKWDTLGTTSATTFTDTKVSSGSTYTYTVRCINSSGKYCSAYIAKGWNCTFIAAPKINNVACAENGVKLSWDSVKGAVKYRVFYKNANDNWERIGDTASTSYTHTAVTSGTSYTYAVRCITSNGKSYVSSYDKTGKTVFYVAAPKVTKIENVTTGVNLKWSSVKGAYSYRVFRKNGNKWEALGTTTSTTFTDTKVTSGSTYTYTVRCINSSGKYCSAYKSKGWNQTYIATPKINNATCTKNGIKLSWNSVKGAEKYRVFYKNSNGKWTRLGDTASTSYVAGNVKNGSTYTYTVRCISANGNSYTSGYDNSGKSVKYNKPA